ncbi:MAG: hypothetical protein CR981_01375 [Proteobacteria bacterium]|nr:MAG: hypothetical protein CR981_01375 [Pseudomonadota bacterium]PIE64230.1 MAG: hypothetical protein CSA26_09125 [Desulfobacterales bacterium]
MTQNRYRFLLASALMLFFLLAGCSSKNPINFKIHTEPEGAHVIYSQNSRQTWIYLGVTPLDVVELLDDDELDDENTISLKTLHCGYLEQAKEWNGEELLDEFDEKGVIFWTPRLIKATP